MAEKIASAAKIIQPVPQNLKQASAQLEALRQLKLPTIDGLLANKLGFPLTAIRDYWATLKADSLNTALWKKAATELSLEAAYWQARTKENAAKGDIQ